MFLFMFTRLIAGLSVYCIGNKPVSLNGHNVTVHEAQHIENAPGKIFFVEESRLLDEVDHNINEHCLYEEQIPFKYFVFSNNRANSRNTFRVDIKNPQENQLITRQFFLHGYEPANNDPFYTVTESERYNINNINFARDNLVFLENITQVYHVFGDLNNEVLREICPKVSIVSNQFYLIPNYIFATLFIIAIFYIQRYVYDREKVKHIWVFNKKHEAIFGKPVAKLNPEIQEIVTDVVQKAEKSQSRVNFIKKIKRREQTFIIIRIEARVLTSGFILVYMWEELIPPNDEVKFSCELKSESHFCIQPPQISFSSFRDVNPYHINFTLNNNTKCQIDLSASVFAPFQPYGKLVSMSVIAFNDLRLMINQNPFNESNFHRISLNCSRIIGAFHTFFFDDNDNLIFQYTMPGQKKYSLEELKQIPKRVPKDFTSGIQADFLAPGTQCFISRISSTAINVLAVIDIGDFEDDGIFASFGFSYFCLCCLFSYQLSVSKEMQQQYDRASDLLSMAKDFTVMEFENQNIAYSRATNQTINSSRSQLVKAESLVTELTRDKVIINETKELMMAMKDGDSISQHVAFTDDHSNAYMMSAVRFTENGNVVTVMNSELVTDIINHEGVLMTAVRNAEEMYDEFNVHQFKIQGDKFILTDNSLETEISKFGLPSDYVHSDSLSDLVIPSDQSVLLSLLEGKSGLPIRIKCLQFGYIWFLIYCNSTEGFMFNVNKYIYPKCRLEQVKCDCEPPIYFWRLEEATDKVIPVNYRPTIWDVIGVDGSDKKFMDLVEYLHPSMKGILENFYETAKIKFENEVLLKKGEDYEWYQLIAAAKDDGIYCTLSPMQRLRELNTALNETQKLHDILLLGGKVALWRFSDDRNPLPPIRSITPRHSKMLRMNWSTVDEQVHEEYKEQFAKKLRAAIDDSGWIESDLPIISDGVETWVSVRGQGDCFARRIIGVLIDITDNRSAFMELEEKGQAAEAANREKTQFLANMSHEIRTPMNGIFGMLDVLAYQELNQEQRLLVDSIRSSSFQLMRLLDDMLNLSKIEQGELESTPTTVNLLKIIEPTMIANSSRARMSKISFSILVSKNFPTLVYTDSQLIMQIINNLLSNALKFTKKGGVTLRMKWESTPTSDNEFLIVEVSDTGIGISEEQKKVIFERFMQAETSTSRYYGGTGLGLPLVQEIARFLGGTVDVQSSPGEGSTFIVRIPMQSLMLPFSPPFADNIRKMVLMLMDCVQLRDSLTEWLESHHYDVVHLDKPSDIQTETANQQPFLLFVEGKSFDWQEVYKVISSQKKPFPVCSFCDPGESSPFKYALVKPVIPTHVLHLLNSLRYNKHDIVNTNLIVGREESSRKILVVEDNKQNQFVMQKILEKLNCDYVIANNGQEAIQQLGQDNFDLVFMDCQMPVLNGIDATKIIRRSGKHYSTVAIVALTASAVEGDELTCREAGMDGYLAKPVRMQQIVDILKKFPPH